MNFATDWGKGKGGSETGGCESSNMGKGVWGKGKETLPSIKDLNLFEE
jgi:hypothetical protein